MKRKIFRIKDGLARALFCSAVLLSASIMALEDASKVSGDVKMAGPEIVGLFKHDRLAINFLRQGYMIESYPETDVVNALLKYEFSDGILKIKDLAPPNFVTGKGYECVMANWGEYRITDDGNKITWQVVDDPCAPRAKAFDGEVMTRVEK